MHKANFSIKYIVKTPHSKKSMTDEKHVFDFVRRPHFIWLNIWELKNAHEIIFLV